MRAIVSLCLLAALINPLVASEVIHDSKGFEKAALKRAPQRWKPFLAKSKPNVKVVHGGAFGSRQSLKAVRSESGGLTSLSRDFTKPQRRIMIEFSFAFSNHEGRTLNVWTHEPGGRDASQLNICIQNGALMQFDGRTRNWEVVSHKVVATQDSVKPVWHRLRIAVDMKGKGVDFWLSEPHQRDFPKQPITRGAYRTNLPIAAIDFVSGRRITPRGWYLIDDLVIRGGDDLPAPGDPPPPPEPVKLWTGSPIPADVAKIPFVAGVKHSTIHRATADGYRFLHGAAIVEHQGVLYANWANSPTNENGPQETLQGRRSTDQGQSWSKVEVIAPGFETMERHSHGVLFKNQGELWTICSRFGVGPDGKRFPGLQGEAFVLDEAANRWRSRGIVMKNCWPYDQPARMANGSYITGGQDKDGLPVVAISRGGDMTNWDSVLIPFHPALKPSFAETTVWADGADVLAVIRGGGNVAWVSTSKDNGRTWEMARPSNMPMPRAKAYLGRLSTAQLFLVSNLVNRDTLVVSVSRPAETTLSRMWRIRDGKSEPPRFPGRAKGKQWSYPYAYEHNGNLLVVYSIGKEDCGLSVIPIKSLANDE